MKHVGKQLAAMIWTLALAGGGPALAQDAPPATAAPATSPSTPDPAAQAEAAAEAKAESKPKRGKDDELVCKQVAEDTIGTRLGTRRVCRTKAEWRKAEDAGD